MKKMLFLAALMSASGIFAVAQKLEAGRTFEREIGGA